MNDIKYIYLGNEKGTTNNGVISIGYRLEDNLVRYSVTFCSKNDRFEKSISHKIITGRMNSGVCSSYIVNSDNANYKSIKLYMISLLKQYHDEFASVSVPAWADDIVKGL